MILNNRLLAVLFVSVDGDDRVDCRLAPCSLPAAFEQATPNDIIQLQAGVYFLGSYSIRLARNLTQTIRAETPLLLMFNLTIAGASEDTTILDLTFLLDEIGAISVSSGAHIVLQRITIRNHQLRTPGTRLRNSAFMS